MPRSRPQPPPPPNPTLLPSILISVVSWKDAKIDATIRVVETVLVNTVAKAKLSKKSTVGVKTVV